MLQINEDRVMNESVGKALSMHEFEFQVPTQGPPVFLVLKGHW